MCKALKECASDEYELVPPTATTDRKCAALRTCSDLEYESTPPSPTTNRVCSKLTKCSKSQFESAAPSDVSNRVCTQLRQCSGQEYETKEPTSTSNRECAPHTECSSQEYEKIKPTEKKDRECAPLTVCKDDQYETLQASDFHDRKCSDLTVCDEEKSTKEQLRRQQVTDYACPLRSALRSSTNPFLLLQYRIESASRCEHVPTRSLSQRRRVQLPTENAPRRPYATQHCTTSRLENEVSGSHVRKADHLLAGTIRVERSDGDV